MAIDRDVLPNNVRPSHYDLTIYNVEFAGSWTYKGSVKIDLIVRQDTDVITLNAKDLTIQHGEIQIDQGESESTIKSSDITLDADKERVTLTFGQQIKQTEKAVLILSFQGLLHGDMQGFYRAKYKSSVEASPAVPFIDGHHYMLSTQFEPTDARRAFPCFDEPNLKASFQLHLECPMGLTALSNMPEVNRTASEREGHDVVTFDTTPVMSTYLCAWAIGEFEYIEAFTEKTYNGQNLPVRMYAIKGLAQKGQLALKLALQALDYLSEAFEIDYPLPKLDLLAVPEFGLGAMENWGLITARSTQILFDESTSFFDWAPEVARTMYHEVSHMWFGNLVTMDWWDDLYLNESFATWMSWYLQVKFHPEWNGWAVSVDEGVNSGLRLDSQRNTHPVKLDIVDATEADQYFDEISYHKGCACIRMLVQHLSTEVFLAGVSDYLKQHVYGNATTADLWKALSKASGQDVVKLMDSWIHKAGFPVVTVEEEPGQINVSQSRYLTQGNLTAQEDTARWWIPLRIMSGLDSNNKPILRHDVLTQKHDIIRNIDDDFYLLNQDASGFYRVNYPPQRLLKLGTQLHKLSACDKLALISDAAALAQSGACHVITLLTFLLSFINESDCDVWSRICRTINQIRNIFDDDHEIARGLQEYSLKSVSPAINHYGWTIDTNDIYAAKRRRASILELAGLSGHQAVIAESQRRFNASIRDKTETIDPDLKRCIFNIVMKKGGREAWELIRDYHDNSNEDDDKVAAIFATQHMQSQDLYREFLDWATSGNVADQNMMFMSWELELVSSRAGSSAWWPWLRDNWSEIGTRFAGSKRVLPEIIDGALRTYCSMETWEEIEMFFKEKDAKSIERSLVGAGESIKARAMYKDRDGESIRTWLREKGYLN